jgi:peptidoglycan/xylan/chitin deacetylase (PgdA/CDA1 family)
VKTIVTVFLVLTPGGYPTGVRPDGENGRVRVALTFDAEHPDRPVDRTDVEEEVLTLLRTENVRATFFIQGRWAQAFPETARRIAEDGHLIGSHSHFHARMPLLTDEGLRADVVQATRAIRDATGVDPKPWFRCPWGHGARDSRVRMALQAQRYEHVGWDVVAEDWEPDRTGDRVATDAVEGVRAHGEGAVVLLHLWTASSLEGLPVILSALREAGDSLVTVDVLGRDLSTTANPQIVEENPS